MSTWSWAPRPPSLPTVGGSWWASLGSASRAFLFFGLNSPRSYGQINAVLRRDRLGSFAVNPAAPDVQREGGILRALYVHGGRTIWAAAQIKYAFRAPLDLDRKAE